MADETKTTISALDILRGFGSTRFGVVLAAMGLIYMIVGLTLEAENKTTANIAEIGCYLITFLAVCHITSRTIKKNNGQNHKTELPSDRGEIQGNQGSVPGDVG